MRKDINYEVTKIFNNITKTHYTPTSKNEEKLNKKKYITTKVAIGDLPFLKPGQGEVKVIFNKKIENDYINKILREDT